MYSNFNQFYLYYSSMLKYVVFLWVAIQFYGIFFYIKATLKGDTKPNRVTRLMRSIAPLIATIAALSDGVRRAVLPVFMSGFWPLLIFIASFINRKSYRKLEKFDYICGICSLLALVLWRITKEPLVAIAFAIASDAFAALPTIIKSWRHPHTESPVAFTTWLLSALTSFFAMKTFGAAELAFPIYLVIVCSTLILSVYGGRRRKKHN